MPYKKTYRKKPRTKSYRKKYNRRYNKKLILGNPKQKVYYFKRHVELSAVVAAADGVDTFQNYQFSMADLDNFNDFTNLFDYYKINAVKIRFMP